MTTRNIVVDKHGEFDVVTGKCSRWATVRYADTWGDWRGVDVNQDSKYLTDKIVVGRATVNWSAHGSVDTDHASDYAALLYTAISLAMEWDKDAGTVLLDKSTVV